MFWKLQCIFYNDKYIIDGSLQQANALLLKNDFIFSFQHTVAEYILGDAMQKSTPWTDVKNVLFSIHFESQQHWVL